MTRQEHMGRHLTSSMTGVTASLVNGLKIKLFILQDDRLYILLAINTLDTEKGT